jgi:hypothetical protein
MKLTKQDFKRLQWPIAALVFAFLVGGGIIAGTYFYLQTAEKQNRIANSQRNESKGKLSQAAQEELELRAKIDRFISLKERGLIGVENRLDWIELLARLSREHKLFDFQFEFSPQKPGDPTQGLPPPTGSGPKFVVSQQRFSVKLLHEGDLLAFIDSLRRSAHALIVVRECAISRLSESGRTSQLQAQLNAECQFDWITMADAK